MFTCYISNVGGTSFSTAADLWGAIPYSQAANPEYAEPEFDSQQDVHMAVLESDKRCY